MLPSGPKNHNLIERNALLGTGVQYFGVFFRKRVFLEEDVVNKMTHEAKMGVKNRYFIVFGIVEWEVCIM